MLLVTLLSFPRTDVFVPNDCLLKSDSHHFASLCYQFFFDQQLAQGVYLNRVCHQEFFKGHKLGGIKFLCHVDPPEKVAENDNRPMSTGQTN